MSDGQVLQRLRSLILGLAAFMFAGAVAELLLAKHWESPAQLVALGLCGLGLAALAAYRLRRNRGTTLTLRGIMILIALGSLLGIALHFQGNLEFALETGRGADNWRLFLSTITGGAPLLAPGMLAAIAALAAAATYAADRPSANPPVEQAEAPARELVLSARESNRDWLP